MYDSTLIIVGAKHGQSPIDVTKRRGIGGGQPAATIGAADAFDISDDGSLIWLTSPSLAPSVVATLSTPANQLALGIQEIFAGQSLQNKFNSPTVDPRTPDIILKVQHRRDIHGRIEARPSTADSTRTMCTPRCCCRWTAWIPRS